MSQVTDRSSVDVNIDAKVAEIQREYRFYQKNGEKHPLYNNTWKIFWGKRYMEIKSEGKHDPDKYEYKNDWYKYWMDYIKEFYNNKIDFYKKNSQKKRLDLSPISISSSSEESSVSNKSRKKKVREYKKKSPRYSNSSEESFNSKIRDGSLKYVESLSSINSDSFLDNHATSKKSSNETVTILSVCRTLTVLDAELGSLLSNKIVDLIAKSIELEKFQANSSDEHLITDDNITFLETIKEKLKALISTDLLAPKKIPIAKKCVQNIAQLAHQNRSKPIEKKKPNYQIVKDPELTEIITKALVSFGKSDILPEELDIIKEIYLQELEKNIEMAQKEINNECHSTTNCAKSSTAYKDLSDDELNILIKNFKQLGEDEQNEFISFITEIEDKDPERIHRLQDFIVNGQKPSDTIVINDDNDDDDYNFDELVAIIK